MKISHYIDLILEGYNIDYIVNKLYEEISPDEINKIKNLKHNDKLIVYHGTDKNNLRNMINGFDCSKDHARIFFNNHRGLYVTSDLDIASQFASTSGVILELLINVKNLHGVNIEGDIGRRSSHNLDFKFNTKIRDLDKEQYFIDKFPKSFRPYLSYTMLSTEEPQGLLIGIVSSKQIKRVGFKYGDNIKWYTREEAIKRG